MDYPTFVTLNKTTRNKLLSGFRSREFFSCVPRESEDGEQLCTRSEWIDIYKRMVETMKGKRDVIVVLGKLDVLALVQAAALSAGGERSLHASWSVIKKLAQDAGVMAQDAGVMAPLPQVRSNPWPWYGTVAGRVTAPHTTIIIDEFTEFYKNVMKGPTK